VFESTILNHNEPLSTIINHVYIIINHQLTNLLAGVCKYFFAGEITEITRCIPAFVSPVSPVFTLFHVDVI